MVDVRMICLALRDMSKILWGSYIRIFELTQNLGATLFHGSEVRRALRLPKFLPLLLRDENVLIFGYSPTFLDLFIFKMRKNRCNILFDIADIPYLQPSFLPPREAVRKHKRPFLQLARIADVLLFISPSLLNLSGLNALKKSVLMVPNASNPAFFKSTPLPRGRKKIILCVSGYAPMLGIDVLVDAFCMIRKKRRDTLLKLVGPNIPSRLMREGVIIERNKVYRDMPKVYSESHVCVIPRKKDPYMDSALPIKMFDAMAASRPLVVTNCLETSRLVKNEKCGVTTNCDAKSLSEAIDYMLSNPMLADEMRVRGREAVEKRHSWAQRARTIKQHLRIEIHSSLEKKE